ncbi:MAG: replication-relaxation family protein [Planctomycetales bacterium]
MPTSPARTRLTPRDHEILSALDRCPLTVAQLLALSVTFADRFASDSRVRGRLQALRSAGWIQRWQYATTDRGGAPDYYKLTLAGYRLLHGEGAEPPSKRAFHEIGMAHQHHTRCLAEFIVRTAVAADAQGLPMLDFCRENSLRLPIGAEALFPDCAFRLRLPDQSLHFVVELDNGSERIRSDQDVESWERKIRLYEAYQNQSTGRFRVLVITTRSRDRLERILRAASELSSNPQRTLFYGVHLDDYLHSNRPVTEPCFRDHRGRAVALVPALQLSLPRSGAPTVPRVARAASSLLF